MSYVPYNVIQDFRSDVDDTVSTRFLWSDSECLRYFNRTREEFARRRPIVDNTTDDDANSLPLTQFTVVSGTRDYTYSPLIQTIDKVVLDSTGYELGKYTPDSLNEYNRNWRQLSGVPEIYVEGLNGPNAISLIPKPNAADTVYMTISRQVLAPITLANWTTAVTEPDDEWQESLIQGMKRLAYRKKDSDVYAPELAAEAEQAFTAMVGPALSAEEVEHRRLSANLTISYRPEPGFWRREPRYFSRQYRPDRYW